MPPPWKWEARKNEERKIFSVSRDLSKARGLEAARVCFWLMHTTDLYKNIRFLSFRGKTQEKKIEKNLST